MSERPRLDDGFQPFQHRVVTQIETDHHRLARFLRSLDDLAAVRHIRGQRLVDQHVPAMFQRGHRAVMVIAVGTGDDHAVEFFLRSHIVHRSINGWIDAQDLSRGFRTDMVRIAKRRDFHILTFPQQLTETIRPPGTRSDDRNSQFSAHFETPFSFLAC